METAPDSPVAPERPSQISFGLPSRDVVPMMALVAGVAATFSGNQPTGNAVADFALSLGFVASMTWLASVAKAQARLVSAVLVVFFSGLQLPALALGVAAIAVALASTAWRPFDAASKTISAALVGALTALASLYLPNLGFNLSASLAAAVAVGPIVVDGLRHLPPAQAVIAKRAAIAIAAFAVLATVLAVIAALSVRSQVERGIELAEDGIEAVEQGDQPQALELLAAAQTDLDTARDRLRGPLTWAARWVPVAAQHSRALETAADQGAALVSTAARTVQQADVDKIRGRNGQLDLGLIEAVNAELNLANATLTSARASLRDVNTPWLLPLLSSRLHTVDEELEATAADIDLANLGTTVLPNMFGANGLRRYIVLFVQPSESREFGGFVGAYALLEADQGLLTLTESGSIDKDFGTGLATLTSPGEFPRTFVLSGPSVAPQNLTATPDLPTIAAAIRDLAPQFRQDPDFALHGVITIDPYALAGMVELTGPLQVAGRDEPITADNVVDFLLRDQYIEFDASDRDDRQDVLRVLAGQAFNELLAIEIPGPERLGAIFGPAARANRLSMTTFIEPENVFLDRIFLSADLPQVGSAVDMLGIYGQTGTASKLDGYSSRSTTYDVVVDPATGQVTSELRIVEANNAPPNAGSYVLGQNDVESPGGGVLAPGSNVVAMGLYTRASVENLRADTSFRTAEASAAFSYQRHPVFYEVPIGGTAQVTATLRSQVEPGRYDIFVPAQATAIVGDFTLTVRPTEGWRITGVPTAADGAWSQTFPLDEARGFTFVFERV